jgi:hypothetical protein
MCCLPENEVSRGRLAAYAPLSPSHASIAAQTLLEGAPSFNEPMI